MGFGALVTGAILTTGCGESLFSCIASLEVRVSGWHLGQRQIYIIPGIWGLNQLRNLLPALWKGLGR